MNKIIVLAAIDMAAAVVAIFVWGLVPGLLIGLLLAVSEVGFQIGKLVLRYIISDLADQHKFFEKRSSGEVKYITWGGDTGRILKRYINGIDNTYIDEEANLKKPDTDQEKAIMLSQGPGWFENNFGAVWIGFAPYFVLSYYFKWVKATMEDGKVGYVLTPRGETVYSVLGTFDAYGFRMDDAEVGLSDEEKEIAKTLNAFKSSFQVTTEWVFATELTNVRKVILSGGSISTAGDWMNNVFGVLREELRAFVSQSSYKSLQQLKANVEEARDDAHPFCRLLKRVSEECEKRFGQKITALRLVNIDLKNKQLQAKFDELYMAQKDVQIAEEQAKQAEKKARGQAALSAAPTIGLAKGMEALKAALDNRPELALQAYHAQQWSGLKDNKGTLVFGAENSPYRAVSVIPGANQPAAKGQGKKKGSLEDTSSEDMPATDSTSEDTTS